MKTSAPALEAATLRASGGLVWLCLLFAAPVPGIAATAAPPAFEGVELGTPLDAWRSLKPPGPIAPHARKACSTDPGAGREGLDLAGVRSAAVVCGYVDDYGKVRLSVPFRWRQVYRMDHLRYVFEGGRLTEIRALIANDAFEALVADFNRTYGPAGQVVRDTVPSEIGPRPRVTETWTSLQGVVEIVDPVPPFMKLSVRISLPAPKVRETRR